MKKALTFILRLLTCIIILLLAVVILSPDPRDREIVIDDNRDTIRCAIGLNHAIFSTQARNVGFHYELLNTFGKDNGNRVSILQPIDEPRCWDMLINDSIQVLVMNDTDTIPPEYASKIVYSVPIKGNDVWVVSVGNERLLNSINFWFAELQGENMLEKLSHSYFRSYKLDWLINHAGQISSLSPYDDIIKKYSRQIGLDWRLLSAVVYQESQYRIGASSPKSAKGLMQIKESTAARYGISDIYDPDMNIKAGTRHLDYLLKKYRDQGLDSANVIKFALVAYNIGEGALEKKRHTADSLGFNPNDWDRVAESFHVAGTNMHTADYINSVMQIYDVYKNIIQ